MRYILVIAAFIFINLILVGKEYYLHPTLGKDSNSGTTKTAAFQTLGKLNEIKLEAGDKVILAGGQLFKGTLSIKNVKGSLQLPILFTSENWEEANSQKKAVIDAMGDLYGIVIQNSIHVHVKNIEITGNGPQQSEIIGDMRVGCFITNQNNETSKYITLEGLHIHDVFYEKEGTMRGKEEVKSANGTQKYGWGIRLISTGENSSIEYVKISNCKIENVSHTGIKLTGKSKNINYINIINNAVYKVGGPGIQMSDVKYVHVVGNEVNYSGSTDDSRKWGRGSGLWTWSASNVLIEKNRFLNANGPGDSAGAHIDYNCDNVVMQYNFSANNAGGFCEILGNNYNCAYRFNISVNDGHRIKGENGAFQEGKIFWLSGYQGDKKPKKGPVNSYFYNNTIYTNSNLIAKIALEQSSKGVLIMNNIFHIENQSQMVMGDQMKNENNGIGKIQNVNFRNNLFLNKKSWPEDCSIKDQAPIFGNAGFTNGGGLSPEDYIPSNTKIINLGVDIPKIEADAFGLIDGLNYDVDFLGNAIHEQGIIGAIAPTKIIGKESKTKNKNIDENK
jgi:hypothetical protein